MQLDSLFIHILTRPGTTNDSILIYDIVICNFPNVIHITGERNNLLHYFMLRNLKEVFLSTR